MATSDAIGAAPRTIRPLMPDSHPATDSLRLSVAPMMDWAETLFNSII